MKRLLTVAAVMAAAATPVFAADVGVSISVGQPGFYGRIDIGDFPSPQVVYRQPVVIERVSPDRPPIYLRVPPGHVKHWSKHCREYNACGERVFFVQDRWYTNEYVPRYQEKHRDRREEPRNDRREDGGDRGHDHDHGEHRGHGPDR